MTFSIVRLVVKSLNWTAFGVGILLNVILVQLIVRNTPKCMRIYSKILLQNCVTDLLLLTMTLLFQPYYFTTSKGEQEAILDGLATVSGRVWPLLASVSWIFLVYVSMLGYVSQFIYRYMTLNWNHKISARKYFLLLGTMLLLPLAYCVNLFVCYCPPVDHPFMDDQSVAEQLGLNLSDNISLAGYTVNDRRVSFGFYYIIIICTSGYITMFTLALLMHKYLKQRSKMGASSELTKKMIAMNKQIARNLIVQASMPFLIYLSIIFLLIIIMFQINVSGWSWLQYYNLTLTIPMYLPSALNPIVSICVIKFYRHGFVAGIQRAVKWLKQLCCGAFQQQQQNQFMTANAQQSQEKWAISVVKVLPKIRNESRPETKSISLK